MEAIILKINGQINDNGKTLLKLLKDPKITHVSIKGGKDILIDSQEIGKEQPPPAEKLE